MKFLFDARNKRIGIAIGPRTWFGNSVAPNFISNGGIVLNNTFTGAVSLSFLLHGV